MAMLLLNRKIGSEAASHAISVGSSSIVVTSKGDGVSLWGLQDLASKSSYPLGSGTVDFEGGAVLCDDTGTLSLAMSDSRTQTHFLVTCSAKKAAVSTLADTTPRIPLPSKAHSCHALTSRTSQPSSSCLAVVLQNGNVMWVLASQEEAAALAPQQVSSPTAAAKVKAASSAENRLAVLSQGSPGAAAHVQLYTWREGELRHTRTLAASCPSSSSSSPASAIDVRLARSYALLTWSNGIVSIVQGIDGPSSNDTGAPQPQVDVDCSTSCGAADRREGASLEPASASKKRMPSQQEQQARADMGSRETPLAVPIDETQLVVASIVQRGVNGELAGLRYTLVDAKFGCIAGQGHVPLDPAILSAAGAAPVARITSCSTGLLLLQLAGAVLALRIEAPKASLLSLVGRMALTPEPNPAGLSELPVGSLCTLDVSGLPTAASGLSASAAVGAQSSSQSRGGAGGILRSVQAGAPEVALRSGSEENEALIRELEAAPASGAGAGQLLQRALKHVAAGPPPARLVSLLAQRLAEAEQWNGLQQLLTLLPQAAFLPGASCSWLLPAAARAQQYGLLAPLCCALDEAEPADVVDALAALLVRTTATNVGPRKKHYSHIRAHAEAAVTQCEGRALSDRAQDRRDAMAFARCAAAAVDGFGYAEVPLHPLLALPLDGPALQGCLTRLNNTQVDRLLSYLATWSDKYTQQLGDSAAQVPLPQELLFPTFPQVLEWVRVVLDSHLARLLMAPETSPYVERLMTCLQLQVSACQHLLPLLGCAEHIRQRAPLPAAHVAAATQYTVELLDLSVKAK